MKWLGAFLSLYADGYLATLAAMLLSDFRMDIRRRRAGIAKPYVYFSTTEYLLVPFKWPVHLVRALRGKKY